MEYLSVNGLRPDGRRKTEIRQIKCKMGIFPNSTGSALFQIGNTKVVCSIAGPKEPSYFSYSDKPNIVCHWNFAKFSKTQHPGSRPFDKQTKELAELMSKTVEGAILSNLVSKTQIEANIEFLECDGGEMSAAINCVNLGLINAGVPMKDFLISCTSGLVENTIFCGEKFYKINK